MTGAGTSGDDRDLRARRRAFIRTSHPDVGGDPDAFARGLAEFDRQASAGKSGTDRRPLVHRSRRPDRVVRTAVRDLRRRIAGKPPRRLQ